MMYLGLLVLLTGCIKPVIEYSIYGTDDYCPPVHIYYEDPNHNRTDKEANEEWRVLESRQRMCKAVKGYDACLLSITKTNENKWVDVCEDKTKVLNMASDK